MLEYRIRLIDIHKTPFGVFCVCDFSTTIMPMTLTNITRYSFIAGIFLLPLVFFTGLMPLPLAKTMLVLLIVLVSLGALIVRTLRSGEASLPWHPIYLAALLLPVVYFLSALFSPERSIALFGYNLEAGTFISILLGVLLLALISLVDRERKLSLELLGALLVSGGLVALVGAVKVLSAGAVFNGSIFADIMGNSVGSWTDYAVFLAVIAIIALMALEMLQIKKVVRVTLYCIMILSMVLQMIINFSLAWVLLLVLSLIVVVYSSTIERRFHDGARERRVFPLALTLAVISLIFVINPTVSKSGDLRTVVSNHFNVQNLDIRPSISATLSVTKPVLKADPVLGSGPNTFSTDWFAYKPVDLNGTPFWGTAFPFGVGFLPTQVASVGLLGALVWIVFIGAFLMLVRKALGTAMPRPDRFVVVTSLLVSAFLWASLFVYVPSPVIFYLAFFATGILLASLIQTGGIPVRPLHFRQSAFTNFSTVLVTTVVGALVLVGAVYAGGRALSIFYFQRAEAQVASGASVTDVETHLDKAVSLSGLDVYYRALSEVAMSRAQAAFTSASGTAEENQAAFQAAIAKAIGASQAAVAAHPESYGNWIALGNIYATLVPAPLSVDGAYDSAKNAYLEAQKHNPLSPEPSLLIARLDYAKGDLASARTGVEKAISLKQDYADAYFLLTQIEVGQNNIDRAIESAKTAAILSPDNAGVDFELGLLLYSSKDYQNAAVALAQAVKLVPNYANAKYFLGLALDKLGDKVDAITEFKDLLKSNPDNTDLPIIIQNLEANRDALYQAPSGTHPEKKPTPPIKAAE
jgi:tetratricopeptide (TPR) repeat protein